MINSMRNPIPEGHSVSRQHYFLGCAEGGVMPFNRI
jgi:hypothetical protein